MAQSALSSEEQEVHVNFGRLDERAIIYASDTRYINRLNKLCEKSPEWTKEHEEYLKSTGQLVRVTYSCPVNLISFRSKTQSLELTDEEKAKRAELMRKNIHDKR